MTEQKLIKQLKSMPAPEIDAQRREVGLGEIAAAVAQKKPRYVPSVAHRVWVQVKYMEKGYLLPPLLLFCGLLWMGAGLPQSKTLQPEVFARASVVTALLSVLGVQGIGRIFSYHMEELEAACYLHIGQVVGIRLLLGVAVDAVAMLVAAGVLSGRVQRGFLAVLVYILTPYAVSLCVYLAGMIYLRGRGRLYALVGEALLLMIAGGSLLHRQRLYEAAALSLWVTALCCAVSVAAAEWLLLLRKIKEGEILCTDWS